MKGFIALALLTSFPIAANAYPRATSYQGAHMQYTNQVNQRANNYQMQQQMQQQQRQIQQLQRQQNMYNY